MRSLCLQIPPLEQSALAEAFLVLSPRVQFRPPHFIFIDVESTLGLLGGEEKALARALELAHRLGSPSASAGIADHPAVAQILAIEKPGFISPHEQDAETLRKMPLSVLSELEGLKAWGKKRQIEHIVDFFKSLGMRHLEDIWALSLPSFRERWGELGVSLWRRLHGAESQFISPLIPDEALTGYAYFDDAVGLLPLLETRLHENLTPLFLRLAGQGRFAQRLELRLHCEYSNEKHLLKVEPVSPNRDLILFEDLLHRKLEQLNLENPVREYEIQLFDVPEKIDQLDFFEPRDSDQERWQRLISFAQQADIEVGFLEMVPQHFPEDSYQIKADWPRILRAEDKVEHQEQAIQVKSVYAKGLLNSPRPTLLLEEPRLLNKNELKRYRRMSFFPSERIEASWWSRLREALAQKKQSSVQDRDYYFAVAESGELVWIYQDRGSQNYFLHGYFD